MDIDPLTNDIFVGGSTVSPEIFPEETFHMKQVVKSDKGGGLQNI